jgi:hypothetical protein
LVSFHFGELPPPTRFQIESHLLGCRVCLQDYLLLKRNVETAELEEAPSLKARAKLRLAVADMVQKRAWQWWERPTAFLVAGAATILALSVLHDVSTGPGRRPHSLEPVVEVSPTSQR